LLLKKASTQVGKPLAQTNDIVKKTQMNNEKMNCNENKQKFMNSRLENFTKKSGGMKGYKKREWMMLT